MPAFDVAGARKAGYDDKEILSYVAGEENPDLIPGTDAEKIRLLLARNGKHMLDVEYLSPTQLEPMQEVQFQDWAKRNKVRLEPGWNEDYDMRGLWKANPSASPDPHGHWPDTYKLPNHPTFSSQSVYALPDSPRWYGKRLIDSQGKVLADESDSPLDLPELPAPKLPQGLSGPPASVPGSVPQTGERRNLSPQEADALWSEQGIQPTLPPLNPMDLAMLGLSGPEQDTGIPLSMLAAVRKGGKGTTLTDLTKPVRAYHGTTKFFDEFDPAVSKDLGIHFGTPEQATQAVKGFYGDFPEGAHIRPVDIKVENPVRLPDIFSLLGKGRVSDVKKLTLESPLRWADQDRQQLYAAAKRIDALKRKTGGIRSWVLPEHSTLLSDAEKAELKDVERSYWALVEKTIKDNGYDSAVYANKVEGKGDSYIMFDPARIAPAYGGSLPDLVKKKRK